MAGGVEPSRALTLLVAVLVGCVARDGSGESSSRDPGGAREDTAAAAESDAQAANVILDVRFDASPEEEGLLRGALERVQADLGVPYLVATVHRFGPEPNQYFAFLMPPNSDVRPVLFGVVDLQDRSASVSELFDTGVPFGPPGIGLLEFSDIDRSGGLDVVYCVRTDEEAELLTRAVAFSDGSWRAIEDLSDDRRAACRERFDPR